MYLSDFFPFAAYILETPKNYAKKGNGMIPESSKRCMRINLPNKQQSLNGPIWKEVEKAAPLKLVNEILWLITRDRSPQSFRIQNT